MRTSLPRANNLEIQQDFQKNHRKQALHQTLREGGGRSWKGERREGGEGECFNKEKKKIKKVLKKAPKGALTKSTVVIKITTTTFQQETRETNKQRNKETKKQTTNHSAKRPSSF